MLGTQTARHFNIIWNEWKTPRCLELFEFQSEWFRLYKMQLPFVVPGAEPRTIRKTKSFLFVPFVVWVRARSVCRSHSSGHRIESGRKVRENLYIWIYLESGREMEWDFFALIKTEHKRFLSVLFSFRFFSYISFFPFLFCTNVNCTVSLESNV